MQWQEKGARLPWKQPQGDALSLTWVRDPAIGDDLHQQDTEGPDIWLDGEGAKVDGFRSCPLDGELGPCGLNRAKSRRVWGAVRAGSQARGREQDISTAANICPLKDCDFPQSGPRGSKEHPFWGPVAKVGRSGPRYLGCGRGLALLGPPHWFSWCTGELQLLKSGVLEVTGSLGMAELQGTLNSGHTCYLDPLGEGKILASPSHWVSLPLVLLSFYLVWDRLS